MMHNWFEVSARHNKKAKINEMFFDENAGRWFRCKVNFITLDEKSGMEKKPASIIMVQATDFANALKSLTDGMKSTMSDYEVAEIKETAIVDVFPYEAGVIVAEDEGNEHLIGTNNKP